MDGEESDVAATSIGDVCVWNALMYYVVSRLMVLVIL